MNSQMRRLRRYASARDLVGFLFSAVLLLGPPSLWGQGGQSGQNTCIDDVTDRANVCTANDVRIADFQVVKEIDPCVAGVPEDTAMVVFRARLVATAAERWDIGIWVAEDGGTARTGRCYRDWLPAPLSPAPPACTGDYVPGSADGPGGPYYNGECAEDPQDLCGDIEQGVETFRDIGPVVVRCVDTNNDGYVDVGTCTSWDNQKSTGTPGKPSCLGAEDTAPNTKAKCLCESKNVYPSLPIKGTITILVRTDPAGSPQSFPFTLTPTAAGDQPSQQFSLADGESHDSGALLPGNYSILETVPEGWKQTSAACSDGSDPTAVELAPNEVVTCTFANAGAASQPGLTLLVKADPATVDHAGQVVTYAYTVTNSGDVSLPGPFTVIDDRLGPVSPCGSGGLAPGASATCTAGSTITQADLDAGSIASTATASTVFDGKPVTSGPASAAVTAVQSPAIGMTKDMASYDDRDSSGTVSLGDVLQYRFMVSNAGNVTLTGAAVSDPKTGPVTCPKTQLAPQESVTCSASSAVTAADVASGWVVNTATVTATGPKQQRVTAAATKTVELATASSAIGDFAWWDVNGNGWQDAGEPGIGGVKVLLNSGGQAPAGTTLTNAGGFYLFDRLPPGTYTVTVDTATLPADRQVLVTPSAVSVPLGPGQSHLGADFGFRGVCDPFSRIASEFNDTPIPEGYCIWFSSVVTIRGGGDGTELRFTGQTIDFTSRGAEYKLAVPPSLIRFSRAAASASTTYDSTPGSPTFGMWVTIVPTAYSGNVFLSGLAFHVSAVGPSGSGGTGISDEDEDGDEDEEGGEDEDSDEDEDTDEEGDMGGDLPGSINPVAWSGYFTSNTPNTQVVWKWAAAVYTDLPAVDVEPGSYNRFGVKAIDGSTMNPYANSDHAGTPEVLKKGFLVSGARGKGGSDYTGSYSPTASKKPCN